MLFTGVQLISNCTPTLLPEFQSLLQDFHEVNTEVLLTRVNWALGDLEAGYQ